MIINFVKEYAQLIVAHPDDISVDIKSLDDFISQITVTANQNDLGKLIGKSGNMINAIKIIINGCKAKNDISYRIQVIAKDK
jgi:predicted RNA-binding protein YlqC (UPF0109 family)